MRCMRIDSSGGQRRPGAGLIAVFTHGRAAPCYTTPEDCDGADAQATGPSYDEIAERAYLIHLGEQEGGNAVENWLRAERELRVGESNAAGGAEGAAGPGARPEGPPAAERRSCRSGRGLKDKAPHPAIGPDGPPRTGRSPGRGRHRDDRPAPSAVGERRMVAVNRPADHRSGSVGSPIAGRSALRDPPLSQQTHVRRVSRRPALSHQPRLNSHCDPGSPMSTGDSTQRYSLPTSSRTITTAPTSASSFFSPSAEAMDSSRRPC